MKYTLLFIIFIVSIISVLFVNANTVCYQEFANETTVCGAIANNNSYNSSTWVSGFNGYLLSNYTIPSNAILNNTIWQTKYSNIAIINYTLPLSCLNYSSQLLVRIYGYSSAPVNASCYDGTAWYSVGNGTPRVNTPASSQNVLAIEQAYDGNWATAVIPSSITWGYPTYSGNELIYEEGIYWELTPLCTENWLQYNTSCNGFNYTILYNDTNQCNTTIDLPLDNGTIINCSLPINCTEVWYQLLSDCINGTQNISYIDLASCNTTINYNRIMSTSQNCSTSSNVIVPFV